MKFFAPTFQEAAFTCPHCSVYAVQQWFSVVVQNGYGGSRMQDYLTQCRCSHCEGWSVWAHEKMIDPDTASAAMPHEDMPEDCKEDFMEARSIISRSPRGAAALLRLTVQKLMPHLGEKGKNIDADIASLVQKGLPLQVQQALDACRVIGNESVHPGEMNLADSPEVAKQMCDLVNYIIENRISQPKKIQEIYSSIPASKQAGIAVRDKPKT
jgi:hypothetical protein